MGDRIKHIKLDSGSQRGVRAAGEKGVNEGDKSRVDVARALSSKRKKDIIRVGVMLGVIGMF